MSECHYLVEIFLTCPVLCKMSSKMNKQFYSILFWNISMSMFGTWCLLIYYEKINRKLFSVLELHTRYLLWIKKKKIKKSSKEKKFFNSFFSINGISVFFFELQTIKSMNIIRLVWIDNAPHPRGVLLFQCQLLWIQYQ